MSQTLDALLFLISQTTPGGPLALLHSDGQYISAAAYEVIMTRAGMPVALMEGSFTYDLGSSRDYMGLYGVRLPISQGGQFVGVRGEMGEEATIQAQLSRHCVKPPGDGTPWRITRLDPGSVPAEEHLRDEHRRGELEIQRALPQLIDQGVALLQARALHLSLPVAEASVSRPRF